MGNGGFVGGGVNVGGMGGMNSGLQGLGGRGQAPAAPGLSIASSAQLGGALNAARLGGAAGGFGGMQQGGNCGGGGQGYNPSGEILAMINKGQNLGLGMPQSHGMVAPSLPQGIGQAPP